LRKPSFIRESSACKAGLTGSTPDEFRAFIGKELPKYARIVKESGARVD
jgi:hypothetical protein